MENLKTLIIRHGHFSGSPKLLPNSLRVLEGCIYPPLDLPSYFLSFCFASLLCNTTKKKKDLPSHFHPKDLVICNFRCCDTTKQFKWEYFLKQASETYLYELSYINKSILRLFIYFLFICMFFNVHSFFHAEVQEYESFKV